MQAVKYYTIVIPHRYWTTEFKMHSIIMYGVCYIEHDIRTSRSRSRKQRVYACGFHLTESPDIYACLWPGSKPNFSIVGSVLTSHIYSYLPVDIVKIILKYL